MNSFFSLPYEEDQVEASHRTLLDSLPPPSPPPPPFLPNWFGQNGNTLKGFAGAPAPVAGILAGDKSDSDIGLMSCTESLGFESSDEMISSLDELGNFNNNGINTSGNESSSSLSSSPSSASSSCVSKKKERWSSEKTKFPPPLTSLSENGRRSFTLRPVRKDGRLEIVGEMIHRPEILCASRQNGRLRLHLVQTNFDTGDEEEEEEEGKDEDDEEERENEEEERMEEEGREWKVITGGGSRRCYYHNEHELHVWGPQQQRFVATI